MVSPAQVSYDVDVCCYTLSLVVNSLEREYTNSSTLRLVRKTAKAVNNPFVASLCLFSGVVTCLMIVLAALLLLVGDVAAAICRPDDVLRRPNEGSQWNFELGVCTDVNLAHKALGDAGVVVLSRMLAQNRLVTTLNLAGNGIGDEGAKALAGLIRANSILKSLDLRRNEIRDAGAAAIKGALPGLALSASTLENLDLRSNPLGSEGMALGTSVGGKGGRLKEFNKVRLSSHGP